MLKKNGAFTLIEMAALLLIFSAVMVVFLSKETTEKYLDDRNDALTSLKNIKSAIDSYASDYGYYPCPGDPSLASSDSNFGKGLRGGDGYCDTSGNLVTLDLSSDSAAETAIAVEYSPDTTIDFAYGVVPCQDLQLEDDCMYSPEGHKYLYGVSYILSKGTPTTEYLTSTPTTTATAKAAFVSNHEHKFKLLKEYDTGQTVPNEYLVTANRYNSDTNNEPHFVLVYHGEDGIGAWTAESNTRIQPIEVSSGVYANDNAYQAINHDLHDGRDEYFLMPDKPLGNPDANLSSEVNKTVFGDIVVWGQNSTVEGARQSQVHCRTCSSGYKYQNDGDGIEYIATIASSSFNTCDDLSSTSYCGCDSDNDCNTGECCVSGLCTGGGGGGGGGSLGTYIDKLYYVDARNDVDIQEFGDGDTLEMLIYLRSDDYNIRASLTCGSESIVDDVQFTLTGATTFSQLESATPWSVFKDYSGNFVQYRINEGAHTLVIEPIDSGGNVLETITVNFYYEWPDCRIKAQRRPGDNPEDLSYSLRDSGGVELHSMGHITGTPFAATGPSECDWFTDDLYVDPGCFYFYVYDEGGDGLNGSCTGPLEQRYIINDVNDDLGAFIGSTTHGSFTKAGQYFCIDSSCERTTYEQPVTALEPTCCDSDPYCSSACDGNCEVEIRRRPGNTPQDTSYAITNTAGTDFYKSDGYTTGNSFASTGPGDCSWYEESVYLPPGCYHLQVYDEAGDGIDGSCSGDAKVQVRYEDGNSDSVNNPDHGSSWNKTAEYFCFNSACEKSASSSVVAAVEPTCCASDSGCSAACD